MFKFEVSKPDYQVKRWKNGSVSVMLLRTQKHIQIHKVKHGSRIFWFCKGSPYYPTQRDVIMYIVEMFG